MKIKTLFTHSIRNILAFAVIIGVGGSLYFSNPSSIAIPQAEAGTSQNVSGWAWSDTIGWISLNSTNDASAADYGVNVDVANRATGGTGDISGTAWSENIGWVSFDRGVTGTPPSAPFNGVSGPIAQVDWATGKVTGWARATAGCEAVAGTPVVACAGTAAGAAAGGWDGWIKLSKDTADAGADYGVQIAGSRFSGYAWGGAGAASTTPAVIGWVDFGPSIAGVPIGGQVSALPCLVTDPTIVWGTCQPVNQCPTASADGVQAGICLSGGTTIRSCSAPQTCTGGTSAATSTNWWQF